MQRMVAALGLSPWRDAAEAATVAELQQVPEEPAVPAAEGPVAAPG